MLNLLGDYYNTITKSKRLLMSLNMHLDLYWENFKHTYGDYFEYRVCEDKAIIIITVSDGVVNNEFFTIYYDDFTTEFDLKLVGLKHTHSRSRNNITDTYEYIFSHIDNEYYDAMGIDEIRF